MADRLISADKFKAYMQDKYLLFDHTLADIDAQPTVDAVEVVRCKDCKWYESAHLKRDGTVDKRYKSNVCVRGTFAKLRKADWYCADGERREDG